MEPSQVAAQALRPVLRVLAPSWDVEVPEAGLAVQAGLEAVEAARWVAGQEHAGDPGQPS